MELQHIQSLVLIETSWNVKDNKPKKKTHTVSVLIETSWNVKKGYYVDPESVKMY